MTEKDACALLKARFEKAGYEIEENVAFDEDGISFEIDGYDAEKRVGYEYVTDEAGDSWDVGSDVISALEAKHLEGDLFILVVGETEAPDAAALGRAADLFLAQLAKPKAAPKKKAAAPKKKAATAAAAAPKTKKPAAKKSAKKK